MTVPADIPAPNEVSLDQIDFSDPRLFQEDIWYDYFARLRDEDPVHYQAESPFGPFWSISEPIYGTTPTLRTYL